MKSQRARSSSGQVSCSLVTSASYGAGEAGVKQDAGTAVCPVKAGEHPVDLAGLRRKGLEALVMEMVGCVPVRTEDRVQQVLLLL